MEKCRKERNQGEVKSYTRRFVGDIKKDKKNQMRESDLYQ